LVGCHWAANSGNRSASDSPGFGTADGIPSVLSTATETNTWEALSGTLIGVPLEVRVALFRDLPEAVTQLPDQAVDLESLEAAFNLFLSLGRVAFPVAVACPKDRQVLDLVTQSGRRLGASRSKLF